jgi:hypothetical protein
MRSSDDWSCRVGAKEAKIESMLSPSARYRESGWVPRRDCGGREHQPGGVSSTQAGVVALGVYHVRVAVFM